MQVKNNGFVNRTSFDVYDEGKHEFVVLSPLSFRSQSGEEFTIPAGFITDFASYPAVARFVFGVNDKSRYAAVLHDYLYSQQIGTRKQADVLFREALAHVGVEGWKRAILYRAVRIGGWVRYNDTKTVDFVPDHLRAKYKLVA